MNDEARKRLLEACTQALTGESQDVDAEGNPTPWVCIGGVRLGQSLIVKDPIGSPIFEILTRPIDKTIEDLDAVYPVLVLKGDNGEIWKVTLDFTRRLQWSNQGLQYTNQGQVQWSQPR